MRKILSVLLLGVAFFGVAGGLSTFAGTGFVSWFSEDAASVSANAESRWTYRTDALSVSGERVLITDITDSVREQSVIYETPPRASDVRSMTLEYLSVTFDLAGLENLLMSERDVIGIQIVAGVSDDDAVFALFNPIGGTNSWVKTTYAATIGAAYDVRMNLLLGDSTKVVVYSVRPEGADAYTTLGTIHLPARAEFPKEIHYAGTGSFRVMTGQTSTDEGIDYHRWSEAPGILTWKGGSSKLGEGSFGVYDLDAGEDSSVVLKGNVASDQVPGYVGTTLSAPADVFSSASGKKYLAPGHVLRFAETGSAITMDDSNLHFGGLAVESGATGLSVGGSASTCDTRFGDLTGAASTWFVFREDFAIARGGAARFYGDVNVDVASNTVLSVNATSGAAVVLDATTSATLRFHGAGQMKVATLTATGAVALDWSELPEERTTPFLDGNLTIDASTRLILPSGFTPASSLSLCSGTISGLSSGVRTVVVGGVETNVYLQVSGGSVTRSENLAKATISGDASWSGLVWETGYEFHPGVPVELTFATDATLAFDTAVTGGGVLTLRGEGAATFNLSAARPSFASVIVPAANVLTISGGAKEASRLMWAVPLAVAGSLETTGYLTLSSAANAFSAASALTVSSGSLTLSGATRAVAGSLAIASGATLTAATASLLDDAGEADVQVYGTLSAGAVRLAVGDGTSLTLHENAVLTSVAGYVDFVGAASSLTVADGSATFLARLRNATQATAFKVQDGATLTLANTAWYDTNRAGFTKTGEGLLVFNAGAVTDYSSAVTIGAGAVQFAAGSTFAGAITYKGGSILKATATGATISGAFAGEGALYVDCAALSSSPVTVLTVPSGSAAALANAKTGTSGWGIAASGNSLVATSRTATKWDGLAGVFTWGTAGSTVSFNAGTFIVYDPVAAADTSTSFAGSTDSTTVPGYVGTSIKPYTVFSSAADGHATAPGYALRLSSSYKATTINANFNDLAFGGLLAESGASNFTISHSDSSTLRATHFGDTRTTGVETWFVFNETVKFTRAGAFTIHGKANFDVASGKVAILNASRELDEYQPTLDPATKTELKAHGLGAIGVRTLVAEGGVTLDFSDLPSGHASTPFIVGLPTTSSYTSGTGNLKIDRATLFKFPSWLAADTAFPLCWGTLTGGTNGLWRVVTGTTETYAYLTFSGNTVSYSTTAINETTIRTGAYQWSDLVWKNGWKSGRPVVIHLTGDVTLFRYDEAETIPSVTFDGPYNVGFGYDTDSVSQVLTENGATLVPLTYTWIGPASGGVWEDGDNWSCGGEPCPNAKVCFKTSTEVSSHTAVNGSLYLYEGVTLRLHDSAGGTFQGVTGGTLALCGAGTLVLAPHAETGYSVDGATIATEAGACHLASDSDTVLVRNLTLATSGGSTRVDGTALKVEGSLSFANDGWATELGAVSDGTTVQIKGSPHLVKTGSGLVVLACSLGTATAAHTGAITVEEGTLALSGRFLGTFSGAGHVGVLEGETLEISGTSFTEGGFVGAGTVKVNQLPSWDAGAAFAGIGWTGTLWLDGLTLEAFNPTKYGNANSSIRLSGCSGYFRSGSFEVPTRLSMVDDETLEKPAFDMTYGWPDATVTVGELVGAGELKLSFTADGGRPSEVDLDRFAGFTGSLTVQDGGMVVTGGAEATIAEEAVWTPSPDNSIQIDPGSTVIDNGRFDGPVSGGGTVRYTGEVDSSKIEEAALFTDIAWTGTVEVVDATLVGTRLDRGGNDSSTLTLQNVIATNLTEQTVKCPVVISGAGVTVASISAPVTFAKITGTGPIALADSCTGLNIWRFNDVSDYMGTLLADTQGESAFGIGSESAYRTAGSIDFASGVTIRSCLGWSALRAYFADTLTVIGDEGDLLISTYDSPIDDYGYVRVSLAGLDSRLVYRLGQSGDGNLYIVEGSTPPTMDIAEVGIDFGVDMTNAAVSVTITNFWEGISYKGPTYLRVWIYDDKGPVTVLGAVVKGDGRYELGTVTLPDVNGQNYSYRVEIEGGETIYSRRETLALENVIDPLAHLNENWIYEDAETFPPDAPEKTGVWTWTGADADSHLFVTEGVIRIDPTGASDAGFARFTATDAAKDIVKFDLDFTVDEASETAVSTSDGMQGAFILSGEVGDEDFQVWNPGAGAYEAVDASLKTDVAKHHFQATFNYLAGTVSYALDGCTLTNAHYGTGLFPLSDEQIAANRIQRVNFYGGADVEVLAGGQYGTNIVQTVSGGVTNEYRSLDAAIAAVGDDLTTKIKLLWNASWNPTTNMVGRTYDIDLNGHDVVFGAAVTNDLVSKGYRVVDKGHGSYLIDVIEFYLTFDPNAADATGVMAAQAYSVTNLVFNLVSNSFEREGWDFANWRTEEVEGATVRTYSDKGSIDMGVFGLTNLTLYADWKVRVRTITVEPTDEYVYLEYVTTNGVKHTGVQYYAHEEETEAAKGRGTALIPVENGSDLVVTFSTDIEKLLSYSRLNSRHAVVYDGTLTNAMPKVVAGLDDVLTEIQYWAMSRGISLDALAKSMFSKSSFALNRDTLLDEKTEVKISDFKVTAESCSFKVTIDGEPLDEPSRLKGMIKATNNLAGEWTDVTDFTVNDDGEVTVKTEDAGAFVKIVIPQD